jgi:hypothetical protein
MPVKPPIVNRKIKPTAQIRVIDGYKIDPNNDANHLKILIPVGTAMIIVAAVK